MIKIFCRRFNILLREPGQLADYVLNIDSFVEEITIMTAGVIFIGSNQRPIGIADKVLEDVNGGCLLAVERTT